MVIGISMLINNRLDISLTDYGDDERKGQRVQCRALSQLAFASAFSSCHPHSLLPSSRVSDSSRPLFPLPFPISAVRLPRSPRRLFPPFRLSAFSYPRALRPRVFRAHKVTVKPLRKKKTSIR